MEFPHILPDRTRAELAASIRAYIDWRGGIDPAAFAITDAALDQARAHAWNILSKQLDAEQIEEMQVFLDMVVAAKRAKEAAPQTTPRSIGTDRTGRTLGEWEAEHRPVREAVATLLECEESGWGQTYSWLKPVTADFGLRRVTRCPACRKNGRVKLRNRHQWSFQCGCGHMVTFPLDERDGPRCSCKLCDAQRASLLQRLRATVAEAESSTLQWLAQRQEQFQDMHPLPDEAQMQHDYSANRLRITKKLWDVLALSPMNPEEFVAAVNKVVHRTQFSDAWLINLACNRKVVYRTKLLLLQGQEAFDDDPSIVGLLLAQAKLRWVDKPVGRDYGSDVAIYSEPDHRYLLQQVAQTIFRADPSRTGARLAVNEAGVVTLIAGDRQVTLFGPEANTYEDARFRFQEVDVLRLNPFFVDSAATALPPVRSGQFRLFSDQSSLDAYRQLAQQYPDSIIVPQRRLDQLTDVERLRPHFNDEAMAYLSRCEIDLTVYDRDGNLLHAQASGNTEGDDDIARVAAQAAIELKRQALSLVGIQLVVV